MQVWRGSPGNGILGSPKAMPELLNCSFDVHAPENVSSCTENGTAFVYLKMHCAHGSLHAAWIQS